MRYIVSPATGGRPGLRRNASGSVTVLSLGGGAEGEYRLNGGAWQDLPVPLPQDIAAALTDVVEVRAIGSPVVAGDYIAPVVPDPDPDPGPDPVQGGLVAPQNLFTAAQASFAETSHLDLRDNWAIDGERVVGLGLSGNDLRADLDTPVVSGRPHMVLWDFEPVGVNMKAQFGGDSSASGRNINDDAFGFEYYGASEVTGNYTRFGIKPSTGFTGWVDNFRVFDLSSVNPTQVACDVFIFGGDSNATCMTSEFVTSANRETEYDPRIWYIPSLLTGGSFDTVGAVRHTPFPMIEPVIGADGGAKMTPVHAAAARLVQWSAARGRPLLVLALGDAGSGLMNTQDWRRPDRAVIETPQQQNTASRMWNEMIAMKATLEMLGPAHEVVGAMWSLGQNDGFGTNDGADGYDIAHTPEYHAFFSDVREEFGDIPMVLSNIAPHIVERSDGNGNPGFGSSRRDWLNRFDMDSGHPNAIANFRVIQPKAGNPAKPDDLSDPHYDAHGMQENGRDFGDAMLALLTG